MTSLRRHSVAARAVWVLLALAFATAACGGSSKPLGAGSSSPSVSPSPSASSSASTTGTTTGKSSTSGGTTRSSSTTGTPAPKNTGPSPAALPWTPSPDVPVDARLDPTCFQPGGLVTLKVHTRPKAGVAYIANYSDNGTGAPKPTGSGYGGNDKGFSNDNGDFTSAFYVSRDAPPGPGRVDVIVGWHNEWGYDGPTFTVAGPDGHC